MKDVRPKTIICDIDGTLIVHTNPSSVARNKSQTVLLDGTEDVLRDWDRKGYNIILLTGRKESLRKVTEEQLAKAGIFYDQLVMGIGGGKRYLINDRKPNSTEDYAIAINIERDKGIKNINI
jgi:uncharacterized HAD superfamily protein